MSFSDPFNRVSSKNNRDYFLFQEQLKKVGIDSEEKARAALYKSRISMFRYIIITVVFAFVVSLIWPELMGMVIVFGFLILAWLLITMARGQRMMKQYIRQEFSCGPDNRGSR